VYQLTFPTDHDIIGGFMPGLGTKMAQGYVTVDEIEQEAPASGEDACHLCQHPTVVHASTKKPKDCAIKRTTSKLAVGSGMALASP
jgi:hypothetical protein